MFVFALLFVCMSNQASAGVLDTTICNGSSVILSSPRINADKYSWNTGEITPNIKVKPSLTSSYRVISIIQKDTLVDTLRVIVMAYPAKPLISFADSSISVKNLQRLGVKWFKNNLELSNKKDTLRYPTEGVYKAKLGNNNLCWTSSDPIYLTKDYDTTKPSIDVISFPNPSTGSFNVYITQGKKLSQHIKIKIFNASGTELYATSIFIYQSYNLKLPVALPFGTKGQVLISCSINNKVITKTHIIN